MQIILRTMMVLGAVFLVGCDTGPKSSIGFSLPDGDVEQGRADYTNFACNACHVTDDVSYLDADDDLAPRVVLGGETTRIKTYGELVTSIINPSHRVARRHSPTQADASGQSKMVTFNDVMTVTQLIDLVAYVQSKYQLSPYTHSSYPVYWTPEKADKDAQ
jgi:sulfur-oxidizing protein SoxX